MTRTLRHSILLPAAILLTTMLLGCEPLRLGPDRAALQRRYLRAVEQNDLPAARLCLAEGVNVNARDYCGRTAAAIAVEKDFGRMLRMLRTHGGLADADGYG